MTVSAIASRITYVGNGATTDFSYPFEITDTSSLAVIKVTISSLLKETLVEDVDYTVDTGTSEVTILGAPLSSLFAVELIRVEPFEQPTSYSTQGNFSPSTLEAALDYVTMLVQQLLSTIRYNSNLTLATVTVATLPSALTAAPSFIYVRDAAGGGIPCFSDGTNWRRVDTREIVS